MSVVRATGMEKRYGDVDALDGFDLHVEKGRIVGLIGPNGSGKTTALQCLLGLNRLDDGSIDVLGFDPWRQRAEMMERVAYIADTGILPKWMRVRDLLSYVESVHPEFDRAKAEERLERTEIRLDKRIRVLSKGMHVQLHLALILAIGAELLVLDEPTLGLDILYRQNFYDSVLSDYFTEERSILVTTHEVREIEHILTDVVFIHHGRVKLASSMEDLANDFVKLTCAEHAEVPAGAMSRRSTLAGVEYIYSGIDQAELAACGDTTVPNLAELFVALVGDDHE